VALAWAGVEAQGDGVELLLAVVGQIRPLGQVLPQQPIGVLVAAPLPWAMRIGKENLHPGAQGQRRVIAHLAALVWRGAGPPGLDSVGRYHTHAVTRG